MRFKPSGRCTPPLMETASEAAEEDSDDVEQLGGGGAGLRSISGGKNRNANDVSRVVRVSSQVSSLKPPVPLVPQQTTFDYFHSEEP